METSVDDTDDSQEPSRGRVRDLECSGTCLTSLGGVSGISAGVSSTSGGSSISAGI